MHAILAFLLYLLSGIAFAQSTLTSPETTKPAEASVTPAPVEAMTPPPPPTPAPVVVKVPKMTWSGDLRYRIIRFQEANDETRRKQQLRARLGVRAEVNPDADAVIRLATASSAISANQTLGDPDDPGSARRSFGLDLAYIDWNLLNGGEAWVGRTANPFWAPNKAQLIFDADLAFEGVALKYDRKWDTFGVFASAGGFILSENFAGQTDIVDTGLLGGEIGFTLKQSFWSSTFHAGNYVYTNIQNRPITGLDKNAKIDPFSEPYMRYQGNSLTPDNILLPTKYFFQHQFALFELGMEHKVSLGPLELGAFYDWVRNHKITDGDRAYEYGLTGKWRYLFGGVAWINKGADAVIGAFSDSDSNGGGTDNKGSRWWLGTQLGKNAQLSLTFYKARRGLTAVPRDFSNTQCDFSVSF